MFYNIKCFFYTFICKNKNLMVEVKKWVDNMDSVNRRGEIRSFELNFCRDFCVLMCQNVFRGIDSTIWNGFCRLRRRIYIQNSNC